MRAAPLPANETERLSALRDLELLDTLPEAVYDDITRIATEITGMPIALLTLLDSDRQWFKSRLGLEVNETPRDHSFCAHAILEPNEMMIVEDARFDERFHDNPLTTGDPHVVFYAGVPVVDSDAHAFGTLCVIDSRPRNLTESKQMALKALAKLVNVYFELRKTQIELKRLQAELQQVSQAQKQTGWPPNARIQPLTERILGNVDALITSRPQPGQDVHLRSLQHTVQALKRTML